MKDAPIATDHAALAADPGPAPSARFSRFASGLIGSEILKIAGDVRNLKAAGQAVCDLTVGDFDPKHFPIPDRLRDAITQALAKGETNYPPSNGVIPLREAVKRFYARELKLDYPLDSFMVAGGSRPLIYSLYRTVVDPGDRVVYPVPSWNNNHYSYLSGAEGVPLVCRAEDLFLPTRKTLEPVLPGARLLCLNSPLNPTGTAFDADGLRAICELVVDENAGRERRGERPLYVMYDHVYWMLCFGGVQHVTPSGLVPEMARYTVYVDGISKAFAGTGVRVGWGVGPTDVIARMTITLAHMGAWAPRSEQFGTVDLLEDAQAIAAYHATFLRGVQARLDGLHAGLQAMKAEGLPVDSIAPMGAIYLTARLAPFGKRTPDGTVLETNEQVRQYLLKATRIAVVPFQAFGVKTDDGWFRLSVGAVGEAELTDAIPRLAEALRALA
ncbi:MAG: aminotransferase class I/II-fold pyridoxal phosphate-dependent enzyme [Vicinamibacteria bacterium]